MKYEASDFSTSEDNNDFVAKGRFGTVRSCDHRELGTIAVKCIDLHGSPDDISKKQEM